VLPGGLAEGRLRAADTVLAVNGTPVWGHKAATEALRDACGLIEVEVLRGADLAGRGARGAGGGGAAGPAGTEPPPRTASSTASAAPRPFIPSDAGTIIARLEALEEYVESSGGAAGGRAASGGIFGRVVAVEGAVQALLEARGVTPSAAASASHPPAQLPEKVARLEQLLAAHTVPATAPASAAAAAAATPVAVASTAVAAAAEKELPLLVKVETIRSALSLPKGTLVAMLQAAHTTLSLEPDGGLLSQANRLLRVLHEAGRLPPLSSA